ncbi:hypothetical protein IU433_11640 [Nocardia puris]|uniref:hypothetical protein n=1 Tax=Nocardia puris TaxID=208602 RepID=UPI001895891C|nr:hypothetical protein [Nocardia puris]MBF6214224.1 hypothetical protein [Nocardia puris]MBF6365286.1 hypothetical protein [Nocardia puris]MBF6459688.1 hypothetical protein [Nocardia puris]
MTTACDSTPDPSEDRPTPIHATTPPAAIPTTSVTLPADVPSIGAPDGIPDVTPIRRWAADLVSNTLPDLEAKCWTVAPAHVAEVYERRDAVLAAAAGPGAVEGETLVWRDGDIVLAVPRAALATGYACPRRYAPGERIGFDDADARHTVYRYLARFTGEPVDPDDKEDAYPLVCRATPADWDPEDTGTPIPAPLANNPGVLTGTKHFSPEEMRSAPLRAGYHSVSVPVTNAAGFTLTRTFLLAERPAGYCLGDVTP